MPNKPQSASLGFTYGMRGDLKGVKRLKSKGSLEDALAGAVYWDQMEVVRFLLDEKKIRVTDFVLGYLVIFGSTQIVRLLVCRHEKFDTHPYYRGEYLRMVIWALKQNLPKEIGNHILSFLGWPKRGRE